MNPHKTVHCCELLGATAKAEGLRLLMRGLRSRRQSAHGLKWRTTPRTLAPRMKSGLPTAVATAMRSQSGRECPDTEGPCVCERERNRRLQDTISPRAEQVDVSLGCSLRVQVQ